MRNFVWIVLLTVLTCGCVNNKPVDEKISKVDTVDSVTQNDTLSKAKARIHFSEPDGVFSDFIFRFMQDSIYQLDRIQFPLHVVEAGKTSSIESSEWTYDSLHSVSSEYTLIFNAPEVQELSNEQAEDKVVYEVVNLKKQQIALYHFSYRRHHWLLTDIKKQLLNENYDDGFYSFYNQFANDEDFQKEHIRDPFLFRTYDDDNFEEIEGWVPAIQWPDYRTYLPTETVNNTIYGSNQPQSPYRTFVICSPSTGMNCTLVFKHLKTTWELVSVEN